MSDMGKDKTNRMATENKAPVILVWILLGVILGAGGGYFFPSFMLAIDVIGKLFLHALQLLVIPLLSAGIIVGVTSFPAVRKLGRPLWVALAYFVGTTVVAVGIGAILAVLLLPGWGVPLLSTSLPDAVISLRAMSFSDILVSIIPTNLPQAVITGQYLGIILFSFFFGAVLTTLGRRGTVVVDFFKGVREVILKLVGILLYVAPLGLFSLVGAIVAANLGSLSELSGNLSYYLLAVTAGLAVHGLVVLPLVLKFLGRRSLVKFFKNMIPAFSTALATGSSVAAFPVTYSNVVESNSVDNRAGSLVLPLGMSLNLNGTAMHLAIAALFLAQMFDVTLSFLQVVLLLGMSVAVSFAAQSVPYAGILMVIFVIRAVGFPAEVYAGLGVIVLVEWLFERFRAVVNVWGDAVGAAVVAYSIRRRTTSATSSRQTRGTTGQSEHRTHRRTPARKAPASRASSRQRTSGEEKPSSSRSRTREKSSRDTKAEKTRSRQPKKQKNERGNGAKTRSRRNGERSSRPARPVEAPSAKTGETTAGRMPGEREKLEDEKVALHAVPSEEITLSSGVDFGNDNGATGEKEADGTSSPSAEAEEKLLTPVSASSLDEKTSEVSPPATVEYGRTKSRRGRLTVKSDSSSSEGGSESSSDDLEIKQGFSLEEITFGRHKKKKEK